MSDASAVAGTAADRDPLPGVLIASNFANDTGYAWNFIFGLQAVIARALSERGLAVFLSFAQIRGPITSMPREVPFQAFEFDPINVTLRSTVKLLRHIRRNRIRFVYLTDMPTWHWLYALMRVAGVQRIVSHSHVSVASPYPADAERGVRRLAKRMIHVTPVRADAVYAVSSFVAHRLIAKACYPESRTHVLRNGIDLGRFACSDVETANGRVRVYVGARATRFKGIHVLIEATRRLVARPDIPPFVVRYAGDGPEMKSFQSQARTAGLDGTFVFLGALPSTVAELCAADVVVVPSIWGDASPLSAIEALAAGKALIATDAGGLPEIVGAPDSGVLVPPDDPVALEEALASLLSDGVKRASIGRNAQRRATELYAQSDFHRALVGRVIADFGLETGGHALPG